jgi:hypothetical protein
MKAEAHWLRAIGMLAIGRSISLLQPCSLLAALALLILAVPVYERMKPSGACSRSPPAAHQLLAVV